MAQKKSADVGKKSGSIIDGPIETPSPKDKSSKVKKPKKQSRGK